MVPSDKPDIQLVFNLLQVTFIRNKMLIKAYLTLYKREKRSKF